MTTKEELKELADSLPKLADIYDMRPYAEKMRRAAAILRALAEAEPVAWGLFDAQGFYTVRHTKEGAELFCAMNAKDGDTLKSYTYQPLFSSILKGSQQ